MPQTNLSARKGHTRRGQSGDAAVREHGRVQHPRSPRPKARGHSGGVVKRVVIDIVAIVVVALLALWMI